MLPQLKVAISGGVRTINKAGGLEPKLEDSNDSFGRHRFALYVKQDHSLLLAP